VLKNKILLWAVWGLILAAAVQTRNSGANGAGFTSAVNTPSGLAEGDLVVCFFTSDGSGSHTWPSGTDDTFNSIVDQLADGSAARHSVAWHEVTATGPGASITVNLGNSTKSTYSIYRITGHEDPDTQPPQVSNPQIDTSTAPNATILTPTGGSKDYLWLTGFGIDGSKTTGSVTLPANYGTKIGANNGGGSPCSTWSGEFANTASSEDAAAWTLSGGGVEWVAETVAVHPGVVATPATDLYGLKVVIKDDATDLYGLKTQIKDDATDLYGLKAVVTSVTDATDLYGLRVKPFDPDFPLVESYALSVESTDTTTHTVTAPDGTVSGDLLLLISGCDGNVPTITEPSGFTQLVHQTTASGTLNISYKQAGGSEPGTYSVGTSASEESAHIIYRISGAQDPSTQAPEISSLALSVDANPDPNIVTPTGGAKNYLWLAAFWNADDATGTAKPTDYSNFLTINSGGADPTNIGAAEYTNNAASENPGAFTISASKLWSAFTIAIHPLSEQYGLKARIIDTAFPFVETTALSVESTDTETHTVDNAPGVVSGDLLILVSSVDSNTNIVEPASFTELARVQQANISINVSYKWAGGSEPGTYTVTTTSEAEESSHIIYRISGAENPSTQAPELSSVSIQTTQFPNPQPVTPTGGAKNYLFLAVFAGNDDAVATAVPADYSNMQTINSGGSEACGVGGAERYLNASSENPGIFVIPTSQQCISYAIAVHPGVPVTPATDLYGLKVQIKDDATDLYGLKAIVKDDATDLYGLKAQIKDDATDLYGLKAHIHINATNLYGLKAQIKDDATDLYGLKAVVTAATSATDLYGLKAQIKDDATDLYGLKAQIKDDATDLYGLKTQIKDDATDLYGLKAHIHIDTTDLYGLKTQIKDDATDLYGLRTQIKDDATDLYGLKAVVTTVTSTTDLYGLKIAIKDDATDLYGLKAVIIAATEATDLYGLKAQIKKDATDLYGLKTQIKDDATDLYGLKTQIKDDATDLYGLKTVVKDDATDLYGLKVHIHINVTDLYGLKVQIKDDATDLYGLRAVIKDDATDLYGLKVHIFFTATDLYGLKAIIKDDGTDLYGLKAIIKTDATDLYGLKARIRTGVWSEKVIAATSSTEKVIADVSWTEKVI
jgi:prophage tail gpP-like protein